MGPPSKVRGREPSSSPGKTERNNNSIKSVDVNVRESPSKEDVQIEIVVCLDKNKSQVAEKNNNIRNLEPVKVKINHVGEERVKKGGKKMGFNDLNLDEIRYIDENDGLVEVHLDGRTRVEETDLDKEMVLEPKFVDYGSIHPTADVPHQHFQQHNSSHALLSPRPVSLSLPPLEDEESPNTSNEGKMTQGDLYQRQPLLPNPGKGDKWGHNTPNDDDDDNIIQKSSERNGHISIDLPTPIREEPRFPQERWKTLLAAIIMFFNFVLTLTSLSLVHERVPDREVYGPLPDVFLNNVPAYDWALDVSEYIIIICVNSCMIAMIFHKHRFIVFRRIFLIMSLLYMYRAITMYVTVLPLSSRTYPCSPKSNETSVLMIAKRVVKLMSGFGLSVNGQHTYCGDFIYSGHTVILVFSYLIISEYTPKKLYLVHWLYWILGCIGVIMLELSHGHYSVDVIIAYYVTTRIFWTYHTFANNASLKQYSSNNLLSREWWFGLFLYFEGNVGGPLPRQFNWPLPWPRRWHLKSRAS
ncbi:phosphatidylcholine:ceramide cholinephosphotransferase 2 isoform X1 [Anoplophora glabripennis]|uniref:phosphatidylcholine:ceramide cholinephosphotransferase 2 isoform X1 n=1 Tax=Anoplophora glabripennis TaxID=217634 RepID=UPI000875142E|nr:phosphatidylcholine:ceramide cholinephosphotransferase 2 isoform X1 [Anoplophora glabripennis]XP_018567812.1 phosphatidylcholine:ceramide cholinephosphotransferase 2 isoform X1 [Anoplophora glabripennis]XP_018567815.1 phosphatidylcholine:ceramide cholinephosphotransferase 2 isoform X1 [Anoplophora glabripennis]